MCYHMVKDDVARGEQKLMATEGDACSSLLGYRQVKLPTDTLPPLGPVLGEPCCQADRGDGPDLKPHKLTLYEHEDQAVFQGVLLSHR